MSSTRRTYTREFKVEVAKLSYNSDKPVEEIAESLRVSQSSLNRWRREYRQDPDQAFPGKGQQKQRDAEVVRLEKEIGSRHLHAESTVKYQFIAEHDQQYPVMLMCRILGVVRSGYYRWRKTPLGKRKMADMILSMHIKDIFEQSRDTYGSYRIYAALFDEGIRCGRKRVARLVRENDLEPKAARRFKVMTTDSNHKLPVASNILDRNFTAEEPDKIWLTDITYVPTVEGWLYLAAVMDLYSRRIVDWAMSDSLHR